MYLARRLRDIREAKGLSQGDIEKRTGLLRCYVSRAENGYTTPSLETLEKLSRALEVPIYQLFFREDAPDQNLQKRVSGRDDWASAGKGARMFNRFREAVARMSGSDRQLFLQLVRTHCRSRSSSKARERLRSKGESKSRACNASTGMRLA